MDEDGGFSDVFRSSATPMLVVGDDGIFLDANETVCRTLGRARADIVGRRVGAFSSPERETDVRRLWARFVRERHLVFSWPVHVRGGAVRTVPVVMAADVAGHGRHVVAYLEGRDDAADGLGEKVQPLDVLRRSPIPAMVFDDDLVYRFVNDAAARTVFGRPADEIVGRYAGAFTPLERQHAATGMIDSFRAHGRMLLAWEIVAGDGTPRAITVAVTADLAGPGLHVSICLLERDAGAGLRPLSPREREVTQLLASGLTGEEIARELVLSPETVRTHVRNAMARVGAKTRSQLVAMAVRQQLLTL